MSRVETDVLPHGPDFRFVTHAKTDRDVTHFEGGYHVADGPLTQKGLFDPALLPEVVAQIGAVVGATIIPK